MKYSVVLSASYTIYADSAEDAEHEAYEELRDEIDSANLEHIFGSNVEEIKEHKLKDHICMSCGGSFSDEELATPIRAKTVLCPKCGGLLDTTNPELKNLI